MGRTFIVVLGAMLLAGCDTGRNTGAEAEIAALVRNAQNYRETGQFRAAMIEARNAIKKAPQQAAGHMALASVYNDLGQGRLAAETLERIEPAGEEYNLLLGEAYILSGRFRSASEVLPSPQESEALSRLSTRRLSLLGEVNLGLNRLESAKADYEAILDREPDNIDGLLGLASIEVRRGNLASAEEYVQRALDLDGTNPEAMASKAALHIKQNRLEQAEELLTNAISAMPNTDMMTRERATLLTALKDILSRQGRSSEALVYSRMLAEAYPEAGQLQGDMEEALKAFKDGDLDEAERLLVRVRERAPAMRSAETLLGVIQYLRGNDEQAVEHLDNSLEPETATPVAMRIFALAELKLNNPERVLSLLESEVEFRDDGNLHALYGIAAISSGKRELGEKHLKRALVMEPDQARFRLLLARYYNGASRHEEALEQVDQAYGSTPGDPLVQLAVVRQLAGMGHLQQADEIVNEIVSRYEDTASSQIIAGAFYLTRQQYASAAKVFSRAIAVEPENVRGYLGLAQTRLRQGQLEDAEQLYRKIIDLDPEQLAGYKGLITVYELTDRGGAAGIDEVLGLADKTVTVTPLLAASEYYARRNQVEKAFEYLDQAEVEDPLSTDYRMLRLTLSRLKTREALTNEEYDQARNVTFDALGNHPDNPELLSLLAEIEIKAGNLREADKVIDQLRQVAPETPRLRELGGDLAVERGNFSKAATDYKEAWNREPGDRVASKLYNVLLQSVRYGPDTVDSFLNEWQETLPDSVLMKAARAGRFMQLGNRVTARKLYQEIIQVQPDKPLGYNNLAWTYDEQDLDKAMDAAKRAYELAPKRGEVVDTYGWFLYKTGNLSRAVEVLEEASRLAPDNVEIKGHLEEVKSRL